MLDVKQVSVRQVIHWLLLDQTGGDEVLTHFEAWTLLLVEAMNQTNKCTTKLGMFHWSVLTAFHGHQHPPVLVNELDNCCNVVRVCPRDAILPNTAPSDFYNYLLGKEVYAVIQLTG